MVVRMVRLDPGITDRVGVPMHIHTDYSPTGDPDHCAGKQTPEQAYELAHELGFGTIVTAEHSGIPATGRLSRIPDDPQHPLYHGLVRRLSLEYQIGMEVGCEANIMPDGSLDLPDSLIRFCQANATPMVVTASQHGLDKSIEKDPALIKKRLITAARNPLVDVLGHPTRYNEDVPGIDWPNILAEAARTGTAIELNFNQWLKWARDRRKKTAEDRQKWADKGNQNALTWYRSWQTWLPQVADSGVTVAIALDIHNRGMWPDATEDWSPAASDLIDFLDAVNQAGISRIVNQSLSSFNSWHITPKHERPALLA